MAVTFGSPEWAAAYEKLLKESSEFKEAAKGLTTSLSVHILEAPEYGFEETYCRFEFSDGEVKSVGIVPEEEGAEAAIVNTGSYETWKSVAKEGVDTMKLVMGGKLRLKGDLAYVMRYNTATQIMLALLQKIDTSYPDEE